MDCLVVADDLTGAADAGHRFAARGYDVTVASDGARSGTDVLVRDTDSRYLAPAEAADRVRDAIRESDADACYKKIDSTLRGNLVAEIDAAVEAFEADLAVVAPAFPANGRTTVEGRHLVDGTPVSRTDAGTDPDAPVETSSLVERLGGSGRPVGHLPIDVVSAGAGEVRARLAESRDRPVLWACDAARGEHLEAIALGAARLEATVLYVGSAGLAGHVRLGAESDVLGVVGSTTEETMAGLDALPDGQVIELDGPLAVRSPSIAVEEATERALQTLESEGRAVVTAARSREAVEATLDAGGEAGLLPSEVRDRIADSLGDVARALGERGGFDGLYLTGGATASAALSRLDADGVDLAGRAVESGVPIARVRGGVIDGSPVVTRAGAFGDAETTLSCLDALAAYDG